MIKKIVPIVLLCLFGKILAGQCPTTGPIVVENTSGSPLTPRSLPWAISCMNNNPNGPNRITFNIPGNGPHVIMPSDLTVTRAFAQIDGSTDNIAIDGRGTPSSASLQLSADAIAVNGLTFQNYNVSSSNALILNGNDSRVENCQFFNNNVGIFIDGSNNHYIRNNKIGVDANGLARPNLVGIEVGDILKSASALGSVGTIFLNEIAYNATGIKIGNGYGALISSNQIYCNRSAGIDYIGTTGVPAIPTVNANPTPILVTGRGVPGSLIEVFSDDRQTCSTINVCQGKQGVGFATVSNNGTWTANISPPLRTGARISATQHNAENNTSEFSSCASVINVCSNFQATARATNGTCADSNNGAATVTTTGGLNQGFQYNWSNGATTSTIIGLSTPANYSVTVTDGANCRSTAQVFVDHLSNMGIKSNLSNASCTGQLGSVEVFIDGGAPPYSYRWSNGATTSVNSNLSPGTYSLTVTDALQCTLNRSFTVVGPVPMSIRIDKTDATCATEANGSATVVVSGGVAPFTYLWNSSATTSTILNLPRNNYGVTVTDAQGCSIAAATNINAPAALNILLDEGSPQCAGENTGFVKAVVSGGAGPYAYYWSNGATTSAIQSLAPGDYEVVVFDTLLCQVSKKTTLLPGASINISINTSAIKCPGSSTGQLTALVSGGSSPYVYQWDVGATTASLSQMPAGAYSLTVTDQRGCKNSSAAVLSEPAPLALTLNPVNPLCNGQNTGQISSSISGGTAPYTYLWSNAATTSAINNLAVGTYTLTATDANGCSNTAQVNVTAPSALGLTLSPINPLCNGQNTGQISSAVSGGTAPYTYLWSNAATTTAISNLGVGSYALTATDANGCSNTAQVNITAPSALSITLNPSNPLCNGQSTGQISSSASGGTAPYTYLWSNAATTSAISNLPVGTYTLTVSDANGCSNTAQINITAPSALSLTLSPINPLCNGQNTGQVSSAVAGGTAPYTYLWSNAATTSAISNLPVGSYALTATDANGCSNTVQVNLTAPSALSITLSPVNPLCNGQNTGQISSSVSGGTAPYTYLWSNAATTSAISNLPVGSYTLTATDANGCSNTAQININAPSALSITLSPINPLCNGQNTGQVSSSISGGTAPYTYLWSNAATTSAISNLPVGTYSLTVSDANGCSNTAQVNLIAPSALSITLSPVNPLCNGQNTGQISSSISGGTAPYTYIWSNNATTSAISNLPIGTYALTATDANGCSNTAQVNISAPSALSITLSPVNPLCNGQNTGQISSSISGGTAPYTYIWSNNATTSAISNLPIGTYALTATDANGCSNTAQVNISAPSALSITLSPVNPLCNGQNTGQISSSISGGTAPYTYLWSNAATTSAISNLPIGSYVLTVSDASGCSNTAQVNLTAPSALSITLSPVNPLCNGQNTGQVSSSASGGTAPYTYLWSNAATTSAINNLPIGTYTLTATDANGCSDTAQVNISAPSALSITLSPVNPLCNGQNTGQISSSISGGTAPYTYLWSNAATTSAISNLPVGSYTLTATDANGCSNTAQININAPSALSITLSPINPLCNGQNTGQISSSISGGTAPYTYLWSNAATTSGISNLPVGSYALTATDANGCSDTAQVNFSAPSALSVTLSPVNPLCNGQNTGQVSSSISGGTAPYTYLWSNAATTSAISNLAVGSYALTVSDANGCSDTAQADISAPSTLSLTLSPINPLCNGQNTGQISSSASGGTAPYTYLWSNAATTSAISNLPVGTYTLTVSDANGCSNTAQINITAPSALSLTLSPINPLCNGQNTGQVSSAVAGGTAPYTYLWSNAATTSAISNLPVGSYALTATDANGCSNTAQININAPSALSITLSPINPLCNGQNTGQISSSISGGTAPYTYLWSNAANTSAISNLPVGTYSLTATDANGCSNTVQVNISAPNALSVTLSPINPLCNGQNTGQVSSSISGGTAPYTYLWSNAATTSAISNLAVGSYALTVSDANGCSDTAQADISAPSTLSLTLSPINPLCNGQNTGQISSSVSGGIAPYTYLWSNAATTSAISNLPIGSYALTVTDANGCSDTAQVNLTAPSTLSLTLSPINPLCNGQNTGQISSSISGGTAPYTYLWSNAATTSAISNLPIGSYALTATDANGCSNTAQVNITAPSTLSVTLSPINPVCNGQNTGQISSSISGGTAPYTFRWSNNATTSAISNLALGTYALSVTDANGCSDAAQITLVAPVALNLNPSVRNETGVNSRDGSIQVEVTGGTAPYQFSWSTGASTANLNNLSLGAYQLEVQDANGCKASLNVRVERSCSAIVISTQTSNEQCPESSDGSIRATVSGGQAPYRFRWSNGETTAEITELPAGIYQLDVSDAAGCSNSALVTLEGNSKQPKSLYGLVAPDTVCGNTAFTLRADDLFPHPTVRYIWQLPNGEERTTSSSSLRLTPNSSAYSGEYTVARDSGGCRSGAFGPVFVDVVSLSTNNFDAGKDTVICRGNTIQLRGKAAQGNSIWIPLNDKIRLQNPRSLITTAENLSVGDNKLVLKIQLGRCEQAALDTLSIFVESPPRLQNDKYTIEHAQAAAAMNILLNDDLKGVSDTTLSWQNTPQNGQFEYLAVNQSFRFTADVFFRGNLEFQYIVCDGKAQCTTPCDTATVLIEVLNYPKPTEGLVLNDPGANGTLIIKGLEGFTKVEISITNRWGDLVYQSSAYDNNTPWRGKTKDNGAFLPPGAYYYIVRAYDNEVLVGRPQTGAIYLFTAAE